MIQNEIKTINETKFLHTWSDRGMLIKQVETGILYEDAIDLVDTDSCKDCKDASIACSLIPERCKARFSYEETDQPITRPDEDEDEDESD